MARCTRYNIMWSSLSVTCNRSVVFSKSRDKCTKMDVKWRNHRV
jgi:hypothetical protein